MHISRRTMGALTALLAASACTTGKQTPPSSAQGNSSGATDAFPVTVKHALGETVIEKEPTRVATIGWTDQDVVAALGVMPVGAQEITWGGNARKSTDWFDKAVQDLGGQAPKRYPESGPAMQTELAKLRPDLILATNSGITKDDYSKLSKIAPVIAYPKAAWITTWTESLEMIGRALGRSAKAGEVKKGVEGKFAEAIKSHPELKGKTASFLWFTAGNFSKFGVYINDDARAVFLESAGLGTSSLAKKLGEGAPNQFSAEVSAERATEMDADIVMFYTDDKLSLESITGANLIKDIKAIKTGAYVALGDPVAAYPLSGPSPLSLPIAIDTFVPKLAEAAKKTT